MSKMVLTSAGIAEIVNAEKNGTAPVKLTHVAFGTGQYTATAEQTALQAEFKRFDAISGGGVGDNLIHVSVQDESLDAYSVYEIGVFTENGTLFAVHSQSTPINTKASKAILMQDISIVLGEMNPASVMIGDTNFQFNSATTEREGVIELATEAEAKAGTDSTRAITPAILDKVIEGHDNIVHRSGNETIAGTKSFTSAVVLKDGTGEANASLKLPNDTGMIRIVAGNSGFVSGGGFLAMGKSSPKNPGKFYCRAVDGTNVTIDLIGSPDGSLIWDGKNIVRSINGKNADENGNITINQLGCLPLTGGTMTGSIYSASVDECLNICGGETVADGAYIRVDSKDNATPGVFRVVANDGTTTKTLLGKPDGTLMWDGKYVTLQGDCLPVTGGTMTGRINANGIAIGNTVDNGYVSIMGGSDFASGGGAISVYGSNHSLYHGDIILRAKSETGESWLRLRSDGTFTLNGKYITLQGDCLPITGGTMTGNIYSASTNENINICGGETVADGAYLRLDSKDSSTPGVFRVVANDGTTTRTLIGKPDGTLTWGGSNVITAAGGTMTNTLKFAVGTAIARSTNNGYLYVCGGDSSANGASLSLHANGYSSNPGNFTLTAKNSSGTASLIGNPDGTLTWNDSKVITAAGGTMTGDIYRTKDSARFIIGGGTSYTKGAHIVLNGKDSSLNPGCFEINVHDGKVNLVLVGRPNGSLTWVGKDITLGYPNYAAGVDVTSSYSSGWTATADGWVEVTIGTNDGLFINGTFVEMSGDGYRLNGLYPVKKGDKIEARDNKSSTTAQSSIYLLQFFPNR